MHVTAAQDHRVGRWTRSVANPGLYLRLLVALVLGIAAVAKIVTHRSIDPASSIAGAQSLCEIALGLWLCSNIAATWAARLALMAFASFAAVSLLEIRRAATSCGCFGAVPIPPVGMFVFDVLVVVLLLLQPKILPFPALARVSLGLIFAAAATAAYVRLAPRRPSPIAARENSTTRPSDLMAMGKPLSPTHWLADLGTVRPGESRAVLFDLTSPANQDLQVRGVDVSCGCTSLPAPPTVIYARGTTPAKLIVRFPAGPGTFRSQANLTTSAPQLPPITLEVRATIE